MQLRFALLFALIISCGAEGRSHNLITEGHLAAGEVIYTNDGKCPAGEVAKITGGNHQKGIPRKHECVVHK